MIRSMTAFARRERWGDWGTVSWELRSLNHRYLEVSPRLPDELRSLDTRVRELVAEFAGRGKVECNLRYQPAAAATAAIRINRPLAEQLVEVGREIGALLDAPAPINPIELLRWPGVLEVQGPDLAAAQEIALSVLAEALAELVDTRQREGAKIREILERRCDAIDSIVAQVRVRMPGVLTRLRERLQARLGELREELDSARIEQELALLAQKMDVDEELDRLAGHVAEVRRVLGSDEAVGRRLDFLMQELNREANTLASKSADAEVTRASIDLKVLIEQMREQVQNLE
jgi:uncharacterized protein (TIGR00255 family)